VLETGPRFRPATSGPRACRTLQGSCHSLLTLNRSTGHARFRVAAAAFGRVRSFSPGSSFTSPRSESLLDYGTDLRAKWELMCWMRCRNPLRRCSRKTWRAKLIAAGERVAVAQWGDGLTPPSQGLLRLFTLARQFALRDPTPQGPGRQARSRSSYCCSIGVARYNVSGALSPCVPIL